MTVLVSIQQPVVQWQIPDEAVAALRGWFPQHAFVHATDGEARRRGLAACDVAFTWVLAPEELAGAPRLRWVHSSAVAVETICVDELAARGIVLTNSRGVQAQPIAEHVLAVTLALLKQIPFALARQREARWAQNEFVGPRLPRLLAGRTLGLIGLGSIGAAVARLAHACGMRVIAVRRRPGLPPEAPVDEVWPVAALRDVLACADVVVIAAPLTRATDGLIGAAELAAMRPDAVLVNVGRGRLVDAEALVAALREGRIAGAALDVFPEEPLPPGHPLWTLPDVLITPHTSGFRAGHWDAVVDLFADNLRRFEAGEPLRCVVDPALGY